MDGIFDVSFSMLQPRKEAQIGKTLNGKELGKGISQRKDSEGTWLDKVDEPKSHRITAGVQ